MSEKDIPDHEEVECTSTICAGKHLGEVVFTELMGKPKVTRPIESTEGL